MKKRNWIYKVFLWTFLLSLLFSGISNLVANYLNFILLIIVLLLIIIIGIIFDMVGVAALTSKESTFHAKAAKKIHGSREAISLIKRSPQICSFCNDIIGDICGIVTGGLGVMAAIYVSQITKLNLTVTTLLITALISSLTVGGKAIAKTIALKKCDDIIFIVGKVKYFLKSKNKY